MYGVLLIYLFTCFTLIHELVIVFILISEASQLGSQVGITSILLLHEPQDWGETIQVVIDLLCSSNGGITKAGTFLNAWRFATLCLILRLREFFRCAARESVFGQSGLGDANELFHSSNYNGCVN
jgi:hypothetical protein